MSPRDKHIITERKQYKTKSEWLVAARSVVGAAIWYWGKGSATLEVYNHANKVSIKSHWVCAFDVKMCGMVAGGYIEHIVN